MYIWYLVEVLIFVENSCWIDCWFDLVVELVRDWGGEGVGLGKGLKYVSEGIIGYFVNLWCVDI